MLEWFKKLEKNQVRSVLNAIIESCSQLNAGIGLNCMIRGGCFYCVFESPSQKFDFRELMAWCRWEDVKTCLHFLITKSTSDQIDPKNLLRKGNMVMQNTFGRRKSSSSSDLDINFTCF